MTTSVWEICFEELLWGLDKSMNTAAHPPSHNNSDGDDVNVSGDDGDDGDDDDDEEE